LMYASRVPVCVEFDTIRYVYPLDASMQEQRYFQMSVLSTSKRAKDQATMENLNDLIPK
jgi:hypothetical protein